MRNQPTQGVAAFVAALSLLVIAVFPQPAAAKSLFESIFGFLNTKQAPRPSAIISPRPFEVERPSYGGRYRTVCVRLCDGYFFPISNSSSRRDFYEDAQQCQSQCQSDTRLYYMSPSAPSIEQARDQRGLAYNDLKTAFLYRKRLSKSCTCRPAPWTVSERMRHKTYLPANKEVIAGLSPDNRAENIDTFIAARPEMIGQGRLANASATTFPRPLAPREVPWVARREPPKQLRHTYRRPTKNPGWGLGASFANGLPEVKYRHNWSND